MSRSFSLSPDERRVLAAILRRHKEDGLVIRRANGLLLLDKGWPAVRVADALFLDTVTVRSWRRAYETEGISSLAIAGYSKREGHLSFEQEEELRASLTAHPMRTTNEIRAYIKQTYGQSYSKPGAIKLMSRLGFVYKKPKLLPLQASPEAQVEFITDYEALCTQLPADETIVFADAVHPEHQSRPAHGWFPKDRQPVLAANSGRRRMNIHAALNLETFQFQHVEALKINAESTERLLKKIEASYPNKQRIHVFLDNARYHHARALKPWLKEKNRRVKLHFLPAYAPHLNPIERLWGVMHKHVTHNRHYAKFNDFTAAILHFFQKTLPDKWPKFRDTITDNFRVITTEKHMLIQ